MLPVGESSDVFLVSGKDTLKHITCIACLATGNSDPDDYLTCVTCRIHHCHLSCLGIENIPSLTVGAFQWRCTTCIENTSSDRLLIIEEKLELLPKLLSIISELKVEMHNLKTSPRPSFAQISHVRSRSGSVSAKRKNDQELGQQSKAMAISDENQPHNMPERNFVKPKVGTKETSMTCSLVPAKHKPRRHIYIGKLNKTVTKDTVQQYCDEQNVKLLYIRETTRENATYNSYHCVFDFECETIEDPSFWPKGITVGRFHLNNEAREWLRALPSN